MRLHIVIGPSPGTRQSLLCLIPSFIPHPNILPPSLDWTRMVSEIPPYRYVSFPDWLASSSSFLSAFQLLSPLCFYIVSVRPIPTPPPTSPSATAGQNQIIHHHQRATSTFAFNGIWNWRWYTRITTSGQRTCVSQTLLFRANFHGTWDMAHGSGEMVHSALDLGRFVESEVVLCSVLVCFWSVFVLGCDISSHPGFFAFIPTSTL